MFTAMRAWSKHCFLKYTKDAIFICVMHEQVEELIKLASHI